MNLLRAEDVIQYLRDVGLVPPGAEPSVETLSGGVSSGVFRAEWDSTAVVVKQALPQLQVSDQWLARVERSNTEARAAAALSRLLPQGCILPPLYVDDARSLFVMASAPRDSETWKAKLMRGELSVETARRVGEILGLMHHRSQADPDLQQQFADRQDFMDLRVDPYLYVTARRRPELAQAIERHTERMLSLTECLVHGDYSPKNLLVGPHRPDAVVLLDHEVTHWGDPSFDTAFCLTHLHLKACTFPVRSSAFLGLAREFWRSYLAAAQPVDSTERERDTIGLLGCILAARVDGKSPAEYLTTETLREQVRTLARTLLLEDLTTLTSVADATTRVVESAPAMTT